MAGRGRRRAIEVAGATEAARLALTLGGHARAARRAHHQPLRAVAKQAGLSASRLSEIERGDGAGSSLETWVRLGIALGRPVAVTLSRAIDEPRSPADAGHLEIQEHILALARATGRHGGFELPTRPTDPSRSIDVGLRDAGHHIRINVECWNTFSDLGSAVRGTNRKVAEAAATWPEDRIATVWVVRASAANRALLGHFPHIIDSSFPGSSRDWLRSLIDGTPPPLEPGLVWFDSATGRLMERRRVTIAP